jgi:predicted acetyltransferase/CRP-like cAMP-binding protein
LQNRNEIELKLPAIHHKTAAEDFKNEFFEIGERIINGSALFDQMEYEPWLIHNTNNRREDTKSNDWVVSTTFFVVRKHDQRIVGMIDIRHNLENELLKQYGGHIGYAVRPREKKKGYATEMLRMALEYAKSLKIEKVMIGCYSDNIPSVKTIEKQGGVLFETKPYADEKLMNIYWVDLQQNMNHEFVKYLSTHTSLSDELIKIIVESTVIQNFKKGTILLREGDKVNKCYLILKGCIRSYTIKDGEEKTIEFYTEEQSVSPPGFGKSIPSELNLECIEDTVATVSTPELEMEMFGKYPELESSCRIMSEEMMANYQSSFTAFKIASAEERYLKLLKERPDLIQRAPQYQLASYLGIQPESLSRIRKRISKK